MLKMRLQRIGRKHNPSYRVLVVDSRQGPKSGKFVDHIGSYDPKTDHVAIDGEKANIWIAKGVQVSPTVHNLLVSQRIIAGKKINVLPRKSPIKKEGHEGAPAVAVEASVSAEVGAEPEVALETPDGEALVEEPVSAIAADAVAAVDA